MKEKKCFGDVSVVIEYEVMNVEDLPDGETILLLARMDKKKADNVNIVIEDNVLTVKNLPNGEVIFFLARTGIFYYILYGSDMRCNPKKVGDPCDLSYAKFSIGQAGEKMVLIPIQQGHKYLKGGCFIATGSWMISFHPKEPCYLCGDPFDEVYIAL
jgi:hypothetical protein